MGFAPASTILAYWNEELLPRESDFLRAELEIPQSNDRELAYRRAIDAASAFAAFPDIVAAKGRQLSLSNLGYVPTNDLKTDQGNLRRKANVACGSFQTLSELNNTYKHGLLVSRNPQIVRPAFDEAETSVDITSSASFDKSAKLPADSMRYHIKISWNDSTGNHRARFSDLFAKAKVFWLSQSELDLPSV